MISISPEVKIRSTIRFGTVFYLHVKNAGYEEDTPHYHIVLNKNPLNGEKIVMCYVSSKVQEIKRLRQGKHFKNTYVEIAPTEYRKLRKPSIVDCNKVVSKTLVEIIAAHSSRKLRLMPELSKDITQKIQESVIDSPTVEDAIKDILLKS